MIALLGGIYIYELFLIAFLMEIYDVRVWIIFETIGFILFIIN